MKLTIHNVGHGQCISLIHENGNVMLWDCGHQDSYRPSVFLKQLGVSKIDYFFVTNYDQDHISDLVNLRDQIRISSIYRNKTISASQLRSLKFASSGVITDAMKSLLDMFSSYTGGALSPEPLFPRVTHNVFKIPYSNEFNDTNNISLVTFLTCGDYKFIIPGDLEEKGWKKHLENRQFVAELEDVDFFIASHHGRENGFCREALDICKNTKCFVFTDNNIQYSTQNMSSMYASYASGVRFKENDRKVLSTRNDGELSWTL